MPTFNQLADFATQYWPTSWALAAALFATMMIRRTTRRVLIISVVIAVFCLGASVLLSALLVADNLFGPTLIFLGAMFAAPAIFVVSAACAWLIHAIRKPAAAGSDDISAEHSVVHSSALTLNLGFAIATLVVHAVFRPYYPLDVVLPYWRISPASWIGLDHLAYWIAAVNRPLGTLIALYIDQVLLTIVLLFTFRRLRAERWINVAAAGWQLLLLANIFEVIRALALTFELPSADTSGRIFAVTVPLVLILLAGLLMMLFSHFTPGVRRRLAARRTVGGISP